MKNLIVGIMTAAALWTGYGAFAAPNHEVGTQTKSVSVFDAADTLQQRNSALAQAAADAE